MQIFVPEESFVWKAQMNQNLVLLEHSVMFWVSYTNSISVFFLCRFVIVCLFSVLC